MINKKYSKLTDVTENSRLIQEFGILMNNVEDYESKIQRCHERIDEISDLIENDDTTLVLDDEQKTIADDFKLARLDIKAQLDIVSPRRIRDTKTVSSTD